MSPPCGNPWEVMTPSLHFLPWDRPVAPQVAFWLLERADRAAGCPDLGAWMVLVPTAEAGRILRQELVRLSPRGALLAPEIRTPAQWLPGNGDGVAGPLEAQTAWCEVLMGLDPEAFPHLFPQPPETRDIIWAEGLARMLSATQQALLDNGLALADVPQRVAELREPERWEDLARLEGLWLRKLRQMELKSPVEAWQAFAAAPVLPPGVAQVVLAALPDPIPWALRALEALPRVEVLVHAPADEAGAFDAWGRPRADAWAERPLDWEGGEDLLHVRLTEEAAAARTAALVRAHARPEAVVVGLVREPLAEAVREALPHVHDPAGVPAWRHAWWGLLDAVQRWLKEGSLAAVRGLLQHPLGAAAVAERATVDVPEALAALDRFAAHHLARTEEDLATIEPAAKADRPVLRALAARLRELREPLEGGEFAGALGGLLQRAVRRHPPDSGGQRLWETVMDAFASWERHRRVLLHVKPHDLLGRVLAECAGLRLAVPRPEGAVEMKGWLELAWDPRPHLVLAGMQEGDAPSSRTGDVFLPESLRAALGLRSHAALFARDAYLFHVLAAQRRGEGRLDVIVAKFADSGEPLRPSRLLFQCGEAVLPARVARLFGGVEDDSPPTPPPAPPLPLVFTAVPAAEGGRRISVTHFAQFLESPFLFHLQRTLGWEETDPHKQEMDALDFGTLAHAALEQLGREESMRACAEAPALAAFLRAELDKAAAARFGPRAPLGVEVQLDALARRLDRFAELQAVQVREGWRIEATEVKFHWELEGWTVTGKIDRIDRHPDGRVRLLDYKTSEKPLSPEEAHLKPFRGEAGVRRPSEAVFTWNDKPHAWTSLQLPIYLLKWQHDHAGDRGKTSCGYVNLPRALQSVEFAIWEDCGAALLGEAEACARRVLHALEEPHRPLIPGADCWKKEPWAQWFPGGPGASVRGEVVA